MTDIHYDSQDEALHETISLSGQLPMRYSVSAEALTEAELLNINERNLMLFNAIEVAEVQRYVADPDADDGVQVELQRLEAKVDLLLGLMNQLLSQQQDIPQARAVVLNAAALQWQSGAIKASVGDYVVVSLHVHNAVAMPLSLPLRLTQEGRGELYGLTALTQNALDKFLFRQHRRAIAVSRMARQET
ncbi:atypical PilZ domain-containing cyclic di-GMP receptor [Paraperlucidibaca baekdonensis]|uniref:Atypical PilZ domain-containing cyclic di-GMP receptor n=1 Tax=Paraperlucidibaca baekdonensis TaxID=748120 RepID=A0A3E0H3B8_9GAMM|nr:PilZ domain-containing protein [Paraperlucidibaca baekdonensis]REH36755.1 atypical PilZ domain-containing cyclic di-GMP receptor [Paraperlucidibaca baekdonensis]